MLLEGLDHLILGHLEILRTCLCYTHTPEGLPSFT